MSPKTGWQFETFREDTVIGKHVERLVRRVWDVEFWCWVREEDGRRYVCVYI